MTNNEQRAFDCDNMTHAHRVRLNASLNNKIDY